MSEPQPPDPADVLASPPTNITVKPIAELFAEHGASDEAPTIISKSPPVPARPDALFNPGLRGRKLAHFELIEPIGVGGMAAVIRARDTQLDRVVALKILPPEMATDPENVRRFHQEARAAAKLDHENIARVFFYGEDQRLHFIAFEFVEGDNLRAVLERRGRLSVTEAVNYVLQIAMGLAHAASRGVVHRDIKPSNIIITPTGRAKLVDMGLARHLGPHDNRALTQSGVTLGTFDYISPEQALEPRDADVRSDIYSLGCTFYHTLTGQPPVPEGTAAKKLHHHQNLAPQDPRQLNSDVPDDVAAVMARMMAKNPRDRYQRAEHLVMHLIQVAQKVGAPAEVPESLLFVDAPLPSAPRHLPVVLAGVALVALAGVLLALSLSPSDRSLARPGWAETRRTADKTGKDTPKDKSTAATAEQPGPRPAAKRVERVETVEKLAAALKDADVRDIVLARDLDLSEAKGLHWGGPGTLRIRSKESGNPCTLTIAYHDAMDGNPFWAGLTVAGGEVTVENVRFRIKKVRANESPLLLAGLALQGGGKLTLKGCVFDQEVPRSLQVADRRTAARVASVYVEGGDESAADRPTLVLDHCDLVRGQDAVLVTGNARVEPTDCTFGAHAAILHLRGRGEPWQTTALLKHCSLLVVNGPAVRLDDGATCEFTAQDTLFAGAPGASAAAEAHLFWQTTPADERAVRYRGKHNAFYKVNNYWVMAGDKGTAPDQITDWKAFRGAFEDDGSRVLDKSPWESEQPLQEESPRARYRLHPQVVSAWHQQTKEVLGARKLARGEDLYDPADLRQTGTPTPPVLVREPNQKVVDPTGQPGDGVYPSLAEAVQGAKSGDVILIKQNGPVKLEPIVTRADLSLTVRPYPGCHPVLTLAAAIDEDAALFRLYHGQLKFEDLEFVLRPDREGFTSQTVVALAGYGRCTFKQCVVTLDPADKGARLSAVALLDSKGVLKMPTKTDERSAPEVVVRGCLVRGQGSLLAGRACRPYDLDVSNSLIVLEGSLLDADGTPREMMAERGAQIRLTRVTTYLTENLLHLYGGKAGKGFLSLRVESATDCLFVAPQGKPLVHLESLDSEEQMRRSFTWKGSNNAYGGFDKMLEMQPADGEVVMRRFDPEAWQKLFANIADTNPIFLKQKLDFPPPEERPLAQALPEEFRLNGSARQELAGVGAPTDELPRPWGKKETERPSDAEIE